MKLFRRLIDTDPRMVTILPYRDLRTQREIDRVLEREYDRRTQSRRQANADRRRKRAVDELVPQYADAMYPSILHPMQAN